MYNLIALHKKDNVAVAPMSIPANKKITLNLISKDLIPFGHKISLSKINKNDFVYKYGQIIGVASKDSSRVDLDFASFDRVDVCLAEYQKKDVYLNGQINSPYLMKCN